MTRVSFLLCFLCAALFAGEWLISPQFSPDGEQLVRMRVTPNEIALLGERMEWLRLRNQKGQEVPFAIAVEQETTRHSRECVLPCNITQLRTQDDGTVEILCELKNGVMVPEELTVKFATSVRDFEQQVRIFGETQEGWQTLCDDGFIFDSSRLLELRRLSVSFQRMGSSKFRILLSQGNFEFKSALRHIVDSESATAGTAHSETTDMEVRDFKMDGIEFLARIETVSAGAPSLMSVPVRSLIRDSSYSYAVTPRFYPVCGLKVDSDGSNFSRNLRISGTPPPQIVAESTINRLRLNGYSQEHLEVRFAPIDDGSLLLDFDSDVAIPLNLTAASCLSPCYSIAFIGSAKDAPYHLAAVENGIAPLYDTEGIIKFGQGRISSLDTSLQQCGKFVGDAYAGRALRQVLPEKKINLRWLLILAVGIAILAMAFALAKVLRSTAPRQ